ncbi:DUF4157 domain-containing protein [Streptomyces sp. T028]|uniref:eCIS core domain-containing protein n=1 Tax=Streptomyces sp. T028 TaxID=3394379 RepID=UPI003A85DB7E
MRSPQSEVTPARKAPATAAEDPVSQECRPAHPRDGLLHLQRRYGNRGVRGVIQAKLNVGPVDDPLEREADRISRVAMETSARPSYEEAQRAPEEVRRAAEPTQHVHGAAGGAADPAVERAVARARGGGRPVPGGVRERMERVSGADFSGVRVHVGAESDRLNSELGSRAFTVGADVFVRRSEYRPGSARGDALLGHELTHTVQQGAALPRAGRLTPRQTLPTVQRSVKDDVRNYLKEYGEIHGKPADDKANVFPLVVLVADGQDASRCFDNYGDDVLFLKENSAYGKLTVNKIGKSEMKYAIDLVDMNGGALYLKHNDEWEVGKGGGVLLIAQPESPRFGVKGDEGLVFSFDQILKHELGHFWQREMLGMEIGEPVDKFLVEFHNVLTNENRQTAPEGVAELTRENFRTAYGTVESDFSKEVTDALGIADLHKRSTEDLWRLVREIIDTKGIGEESDKVDTGAENRMFAEMELELQKPRYGRWVPEGDLKEAGVTFRREFKRNFAFRYLNNLAKNGKILAGRVKKLETDARTELSKARVRVPSEWASGLSKVLNDRAVQMKKSQSEIERKQKEALAKIRKERLKGADKEKAGRNAEAETIGKMANRGKKKNQDMLSALFGKDPKGKKDSKGKV